MAKRYIVHSRHDTTIDVQTKTADGHEITGKMPCAIIELTPCDPRDHHTVTRREIMPTDAERKRVTETFIEGGTVEEGDFSLVEAPKQGDAA